MSENYREPESWNQKDFYEFYRNYSLCLLKTSATFPLLHFA